MWAWHGLPGLEGDFRRSISATIAIHTHERKWWLCSIYQGGNQNELDQRQVRGGGHQDGVPGNRSTDLPAQFLSFKTHNHHQDYFQRYPDGIG